MRALRGALKMAMKLNGTACDGDHREGAGSNPAIAMISVYIILLLLQKAAC